MEGTVVRLMSDKRFGFIRGDDDQDYFFHQQDLNGFFDDLVEDFNTKRQIKVIFDPTQGQKGLRAANVVRIDGGV